MRTNAVNWSAGILFFLLSSIALSAYDFSEADREFLKRKRNPTAINQAIAAYSKALQSQITFDEKRYAIEQIAALDVYLGYIVNQADINLRVRVANHCLDHVELIKPATRTPKSPQFYYWKAACMLSRANAQGIAQSLADSGPVLTLIENGLDLDSSYEGGGFDRLAGILFAKLPSINPWGPSGDLNRAVNHFRTSLDSTSYLHPLEPSWRDEDQETGDYFYSTYFYYAETLVARRQIEEAKDVLEEALSDIEEGRIAPGRDAEADIAKTKMTELRDQLN